MASGGVTDLGTAEFHVTANYDEMMRGFDRAKAEAKKFGGELEQSVGRGARQASYGLLQLGYAVDDLQYGFSAVVNNIPQIAMGLGLGAGVAGAASVAAVAVNQLVKHWADLGDAMQAGWLNVAYDQLHRVRQATEEAAAAFDKMSKIQPRGAAAAGAALERAIAEGPIDKVLQAVESGVANDPRQAATVEEMVKKDYWKATTGGANLAAMLSEANRNKAAGLLGKARGGDAAAISTLKRMANENPGAFPPGFMADLDDLDPAVRAAQEKTDRAGALRGGNLANEDALRAAAKAKKVKADKLVDDLNEQGQANEKAAELERLRDQRQDLQDQIHGFGKNRPQAEIYTSTREYANATQSAIFNQMPKEQLKTMQAMKINLESIDRKISAIGRLQ